MRALVPQDPQLLQQDNGRLQAALRAAEEQAEALAQEVAATSAAAAAAKAELAGLQSRSAMLEKAWAEAAQVLFCVGGGGLLPSVAVSACADRYLLTLLPFLPDCSTPFKTRPLNPTPAHPASCCTGGQPAAQREARAAERAERGAAGGARAGGAAG
jgi:riboflavin biosynthesis pyrimidine reductase